MTVTRNLPLARTVNYQPLGAFASGDINADLDRLWFKLQEIEDQFNRAIIQAAYDIPAGLTLPAQAARANTFLYFDSNGNLAALTQVGKWRGTWATATAYSVGDTVIDGAAGASTQNIYVCIAANTSGTWATDLGNGFWQLAINVVSVTNSANAASTSATNAASSASAASSSATSASNSASAASTNATNSAASATAAANSATTASSSASAASTSATNATSSATAAAISAASINLPSPVGQALNLIRQNAATTGFEYRTPTQVRGDLALGTAATLNTGTSGATIPLLNAVNTWGAAQRSTIIVLTDAATITPDFSAGNNFSVTIAGNRTIANPTNLASGQSGFFIITQDAAGSRTITWGSQFKWSNGVAGTLSTTANAVDIVSYFVDSASTITLNLLTNRS